MAQINDPISPSLSVRKANLQMSIQALKGDSQAAREMAVGYIIGYNDYSNGKEWYLIGAENGDIDSQYSVSSLEFEESNFDRERDLYWLYVAAKSGDEDALYRIDELNVNVYLFEKEQANQENHRVNNDNLEEMKLRAVRGNGLIASKLADYYERHHNEEMSIYWLRIGTQNGDNKCMRKYGIFLLATNDELSKIRGEYWLSRATAHNKVDRGKVVGVVIACGLFSVCMFYYGKRLLTKK
jgi:TPR repeat protein